MQGACVVVLAWLACICRSHPFLLAVQPDGASHGVFLLNSNAMDITLGPDSVTYRSVSCVRADRHVGWARKHVARHAAPLCAVRLRWQRQNIRERPRPKQVSMVAMVRQRGPRAGHSRPCSLRCRNGWQPVCSHSMGVFTGSFANGTIPSASVRHAGDSAAPSAMAPPPDVLRPPSSPPSPRCHAGNHNGAQGYRRRAGPVADAGPQP